MNGHTALLVHFARTLAAPDDQTPVALRLCRAYVDMFSLDGAAVTLAYNQPERRLTLCATDATAARLEAVQEVVGEGPSADAYRSGHAVTATLDRQENPRWTLLADMVEPDLQGLALYAFPMRARGAVIGVLTCYQSQPRSLAHGVDAAQFMADAVAAAIVRDAAIEGGVSSANWMERDTIHQATGMVVAQLGVAPDDAMALLRAHAFAGGTTLEGMASEVVARRRDLSADVGRPSGNRQGEPE